MKLDDVYSGQDGRGRRAKGRDINIPPFETKA
jgi:hypothetical protein